jgi:hypothetical protein
MTHPMARWRWTTSAIANADNVSLSTTCRPAAELNADEVRRYSRHLIMPDVGIAGQKRLNNARSLIIGAGGLGS